MKVILLFDTDSLDNRYRVYELNDKLSKHLKTGGEIDITIAHPKTGEIFIAKESGLNDRYRSKNRD